MMFCCASKKDQADLDNIQEDLNRQQKRLELKLMASLRLCVFMSRKGDFRLRFVDQLSLSETKVRDVNVGAESDVVSQIPADVIGIVVKHNVIAIPEPVSARVNLERRDTEIVPTKPEATRTSAL